MASLKCSVMENPIIIITTNCYIKWQHSGKQTCSVFCSESEKCYITYITCAVGVCVICLH